MQPLLRRLGARLAPPSRDVPALPPELERFYEITDGADVPRLGARLASAGELRERDGLLRFATTPEGAWAVIASGPLAGWVVRTHPTESLAFRSVASLLSAMAGALDGGGLADELADPSRSEEEQALGAAIVDDALVGGDTMWLRFAIDLLGPSRARWLFRATEHPVSAALAWARIEALGVSPRPEWDASVELRQRVTWALEHRGWSVAEVDGDHALRVDHEGLGSWHTIAPWIARAGDLDIATQIADRIVRREERRRGLWRLRRDDAALETSDVSEAFAWSLAPWRTLQLSFVAGDFRFGLYREGNDLLVSFDSPETSWHAREADDPTRTRMAIEHMLLRREPWPGLRWDVARR